MTPLNQTTTSEFLQRFDSLNGGFLYDIAIDLRRGTILLGLEAYDASLTEIDDPNLRWRRVEVAITGDIEFALHESRQHPIVQADDCLEVLWLEGKVFFVFDPLQARDFDQLEWSPGQVRRSRCFFGGEKASWFPVPQ